MKKISYAKLQDKYPRKLVALDMREQNVIAIGARFADLFKKLQSRNIDPKDCVFVGPIQKRGTINVYISLRAKKDQRRPT